MPCLSTLCHLPGVGLDTQMSAIGVGEGMRMQNDDTAWNEGTEHGCESNSNLQKGFKQEILLD